MQKVAKHKWYQIVACTECGIWRFLEKDLASDLTKDYGGNFSYRNLCHYRKFYLCFNDLEIVYARVHNLTWTHFRHLLRIDEEQVHLWPYNLLLPAAQQKLAMNHP